MAVRVFLLTIQLVQDSEGVRVIPTVGFGAPNTRGLGLVGHLRTPPGAQRAMNFGQGDARSTPHLRGMAAETDLTRGLFPSVRVVAKNNAET